MRRVAFLGIVLALVGLWGCGGKTTTVTGPDGEKVTVSHKGDKVEGTVTGPEGKKITYSSGAAGVKLPDDFPKDVPLYPGAAVTVSVNEGKNRSVVLKSDDESNKVRDFYESKLKEHGWTIESTTNVEQGSMFAAKKDNRQLSVVISGGNISIGLHAE